MNSYYGREKIFTSYDEVNSSNIIKVLNEVYPKFQKNAEQVKYLPKLEPQISDFNVSVRTRQKFGLNELNGNRSNILIHLANAAIRLGRKLHFDPIAMQFINDPEANRLANQPMRAPWSL